MALLSDDTLWIFISLAKIKPDNRHIHDIALGITSLENNGIKSNNILLIIDGNYNDVDSIIKGTYDIYSISKLPSLIKERSNKNLVVFITGHGNEKGLDGLSSQELIDILIQNHNAENTIIYLGQCCALAFDNIHLPKLLLIEGVKTYSISSSMSNEKTILYNRFLFYIFEWINQIQNITDENKRSVLASAQYADKNLKEYHKKSIPEINSQIKKLTEKINNLSVIDENYDKIRITLEDEINRLKQITEIPINSQRTWFSDFFMAKDIKF